MISIWTRTVSVDHLNKVFIFAFSDFVDRREKDSDNSKVMDDCAISRVVFVNGNLKDMHRKLAEEMRNFHGYSGFLYGGQKVRPSGHRKFIMVDVQKKE